MADMIQIVIERDVMLKAAEQAASAAGHVLYEEAQDILTAATVLCPRATGALVNSGQVSTPEITPAGVDVEIGFGGPAIGYAVYVHEDVSKHHLPPTQAKFLEVPVNRAMRGMTKRLQQRLSSLLAAWGGGK